MALGPKEMPWQAAYCRRPRGPVSDTVLHRRSCAARAGGRVRSLSVGWSWQKRRRQRPQGRTNPVPWIA